jgi:hypothetical protein
MNIPRIMILLNGIQLETWFFAPKTVMSPSLVLPDDFGFLRTGKAFDV